MSDDKRPAINNPDKLAQNLTITVIKKHGVMSNKTKRTKLSKAGDSAGKLYEAIYKRLTDIENIIEPKGETKGLTFPSIADSDKKAERITIEVIKKHGVVSNKAARIDYLKIGEEVGKLYEAIYRRLAGLTTTLNIVFVNKDIST